MADTITEYQGKQIIALLEKIEHHLDSMKDLLSSLDRTGDSVNRELSDINHNTRS